MIKSKYFSKIVSSVLALSMVVGTIGALPMVSKAATKLTKDDFMTASAITMENVTDGVKVTNSDSIGAAPSLTAVKSYDLTQSLHFEVDDISAPCYNEDWAFVAHIGIPQETAYNVSYTSNAVHMMISKNGYYKMWRSGSWTHSVDPTVGDTDHLFATGKLANPLTGDSISLDIQAVGDNKYEVTVEGNEPFTVTENGGPWWLSTREFKKATVGISIWPGIKNGTTYESGIGSNFPKGVSYVVKDLSKTQYEVKTVSLAYNSLNLVPGETMTVSATVAPSVAEDKTLTWKSDKTSVATVDTDGKITAVAEGTATITATAKSGVKGTCVVTVSKTKQAGITTIADVTNRGTADIALKEVATGVEVTFPKNVMTNYLSTMKPQPLDNGFTYRLTDIHKTDASETKDYSVVISIGNTTNWNGGQNASQWYDQKGYMVLYGKSGNFTILRAKKSAGNNFADGNYDVIAATQLEPLGSELTLYVKEEGDNWTLVVNDKHTYTFSNANTHTTNSHEYWFTTGIYSDFTATAANPIVDLSYWDVTKPNRCDVTFTVSTVAPTVPTLFSDGMMFQQKKDMNVWGYGIPGKNVVAELYKGSALVETKNAVVSTTGRWDVAFTGRDGSYDAYKMKIKVGDHVVQEINDILIGELWIAAGQSNMELKVSEDMDAENLLANANNQYVRFFMEPLSPSNANKIQPIVPNLNVIGASWGYGNDAEAVKTVSAIGYTFAKTLQEELGVPVGFINTAVGGSYIEAWLSRPAVEGNAEMKQILKDAGCDGGFTTKWYYEKDEYVEKDGAAFTFYNAKIGPLEGMNVAGTIWYQGESNEWSSARYGKELELLKESWSKVFGYENGDMPFIFTQLASYDVGNTLSLAKGYMALNMEQAWQNMKDKNTAMLTLYDLPLDHMKDGSSTHPIHPRIKTPLAKRFALAAKNMVYGGTDEYTAAVYKSHRIENDAIYITFDRVGNAGLKSTDGSTSLHGFSIAGDDGVFVNAEAQIVSEDTVKVWNKYVKNPKNVVYALDNMNCGATLCNAVGIPASPFRTVPLDDTVGRPNAALKYFVAQNWMNAEKDEWVCTEHATEDVHLYYKYQPSFEVTGGTYTYDNSVKAEGTASLKVTYTDDFTVSPILSYHSLTQDWSKFNYLAVSMYNEKNVTVAMKITSGGQEYVIPSVMGADATSLTGSDAFKEVVFDLTSVEDSVLTNLTKVSFVVTADSAGTMRFDKFQFGMKVTVDRVAPVISGVTNEKKYCEDVVITVTDTNLSSVTVNGSSVTLTNDKYTLKAVSEAGTQYVVVATDETGNTTTVTVNVYKGHSFTNYVSDNNATTAADGTKTATCDHGCGATDTVTDVGSKLPEQNNSGNNNNNNNNNSNNNNNNSNNNNSNNNNNNSNNNNSNNSNNNNSNNSSTTQPDNGNTTTTVGTGDGQNVFVWFAGVMASIMALAALLFYRKKRA